LTSQHPPEPTAFLQRYGTRVPSLYTSLKQEVLGLRRSVAMSVRPDVLCIRLSGEDAFDILDAICPAELTIRDSQILHTLLLRPDGKPLAELYVCNDDEEFILLSEGLSVQELHAYFQEHCPPELTLEWTDLSTTYRMLSINGPFSWELLSEYDSPYIVGLPYLSFYKLTKERYCFRVGKTGEFGYRLLIPHELFEETWQTLFQQGQAFDVEVVGVQALEHCAFENFFFNIHHPAEAALSPIELQLQWRLSYHKSAPGLEAVIQQKQQGELSRVTGVLSEHAFAQGDDVWLEDEKIGSIVRVEQSITLGKYIGLALLNTEWAYSGIEDYQVGAADGKQMLRTLSLPFVFNRSLLVNPLDDRYAQWRNRKMT